MCEHRRTAGFRLFKHDVVVLALAAAACALLWSVHRELALVVMLVVLHFFLFCNVFRIRRSYELTWAGAFSAAILAWHFLALLPFWTACALSIALSTLLVALEMRSPRYHGILARRINRRLEEYLRG